jgi:hypothetical protein
VTSSLVICVLLSKTFFVIYILMFSVEFLSAPVMCFLWATFLDLYCEDVYVLLRALSVCCLLSTNIVANGGLQKVFDWYTRNRMHNPKVKMEERYSCKVLIK